MCKAVLFFVAALVGFIPCSGFAAVAPAAPPPPAANASPFTDAERAGIEDIVKEYLVNKNPEVMAQAFHNLEKRNQEAAEAKIKEKISSEKDRIFNDSSSPFAGNPKATVTVVEFYDYQCGYCKMAEEAVERVLKEDKDVKIVYKNYPILGPVSLEAAKAGTASVKQGKFLVFHSALMNKKEHLTSDMIYQVAKDVGLNVDTLKKDMADASVGDSVNASLKLGQDIGAQGTPFFIINDAFTPGVLQYEQLKNILSDARAKVKKP
jgi:protein-disulfide isomerase